MFFILGRFGVISPASQAPGLAAQDKIGLQILHPTKTVLTNVELTGIIADDNGIGQQAMSFDAPPQRPLSGDLDRIRVDLEGGDTKLR